MLINVSAILEAVNTTTNRTELIVNEEKILSLSSLVCLSVLNTLSSVIGTFGNVIVLLVIIKNATLQSVPDLFIFSLAVADLVVAAIQQPLLGYRIYRADIPNKLFNTVLLAIGYVALLASVSGIFIVTLDRFLAIQFPFLYVRISSKARAVKVIVVLWGFCFCNSVANCFVRSSSKYFFVWSYILLLLLLTIIMYVYLFISASKQQNRIAKEATPGEISSQEAGNAQQRGVSELRRQKRERKAAKTVAIVLGVFIAFWSPFLGYTISKASIASTPEFMRVFYWVWSISLWNSTINPYIFCARNTRYRSAFARILGLKNRIELEPSQQASFRRSQNQTEGSNRLQRGVGSVDVCW